MFFQKLLSATIEKLEIEKTSTINKTKEGLYKTPFTIELESHQYFETNRNQIKWYPQIDWPTIEKIVRLFYKVTAKT